MHNRFDKFRAMPLGKQLEAMIDTPDRYLEFAALSRAGVPAVTAIVQDVEKKFSEIENDQTARQFCGAKVADVMRRHRHEILRPRGRVPGGFFTYGAVWTPLPNPADFETLLSSLASMPEDVAGIIESFPFNHHQTRPEASGFSVVEHVCHLRDLDAEAFALRVESILSEDGPCLPSVDGTQLAIERDYISQDIGSAQRHFTDLRQRLVAKLSQTNELQRKRWGLFDGIRRMTLAELVEDIHHHDRTHIQELDELAAEVLGSS